MHGLPWQCPFLMFHVTSCMAHCVVSPYYLAFCLLFCHARGSVRDLLDFVVTAGPSLSRIVYADFPWYLVVAHVPLVQCWERLTAWPELRGVFMGFDDGHCSDAGQGNGPYGIKFLKTELVLRKNKNLYIYI